MWDCRLVRGPTAGVPLAIADRVERLECEKQRQMARTCQQNRVGRPSQLSAAGALHHIVIIDFVSGELKYTDALPPAGIRQEARVKHDRGETDLLKTTLCP